jgi:drug/metabolite transporter (DMT)-like permease
MVAASPRRHNPVRGVLWMVAAAIALSVTITLVRFLSQKFTIFEIVFFRQLFGTLIMLPWLARAGIGALRTDQIRIYLVRGIFTYSAMFAAYYSVTLITIADSIALQFTLPIFTILIAMVTLGEKVRAHRWIATVVGFIGALVIIRPGFAEINAGMLIALSAAVFFGASDTCTRFLSGKDRVNVVVFYGFLVQLPVAVVPAALTWVTPGPLDLVYLLAFVAVAVGAQFCITQSFASAEASLVSPVLYVRLPFVAVFGLAFFNELPSAWTWVGAAILFASTYFSTRRDAQISKAENAAGRGLDPTGSG